MRTNGCPGTLHGISGRPQICTIREQADLRYLLGGDLRRAEEIHRGSDPVAVEVRGMSQIPDIEEFEERAAIHQYEGGLSRSRAEDLAAQAQGFKNAFAYWQWLADYVVKGRLH